MSDIIFVKPVFQERIWGGSRLREIFGELVPAGVIGESWAISGLRGDSGVVITGAASGMTLDEAWHGGYITGQEESDGFPLLAKFIDTKDWLSVQVHPNDNQAMEYEDQPRGKAECWYVIDAEPGAEIILGHVADNIQQLRKALDTGQLDDVMVRRPVRPGDFFNVPAGCLHAIGPGMLIYEVQQSSDITYRLYDFERLGLDGKPRALHVDKGFSVVEAPHDDSRCFTANITVPVHGGTIRSLVRGSAFGVTEAVVDGSMDVTGTDYRLGTVVSGGGTITNTETSHDLRLGDCFVIPRGVPAHVDGQMTLILSDPRDRA